jgi:hypothetical protein
MLPPILAVFSMGHYKPDVNSLNGVYDYRDKPVFVAAKVENGAVPYRVSVGEGFVNVVETAPPRTVGDLVPAIERSRRVRVFPSKKLQGFPAYYMQQHLRILRVGSQLVA